jgi:hypothetical protein
VAATIAEQWRSKEQILRDLAKAFHFSVGSLEANRRGKLSGTQIQVTLIELARPLVFAAGCILAPLSVWTIIAVLNGHGRPPDAFAYVLNAMLSPSDLWNDLGAFKTVIGGLVTLAGVGVALLFLSRFSMALYFDIIERGVLIREGRVESSEHQTLRKNGKDPEESYYFHFKSEKFLVSRAAYLALDAGAAYYLYVLPRSRRIVAVEPKIRSSDGPDAAA